MPELFIYLIKVNVALLVFCAGYYAVLRHLTFYNLNRIYLVTAIIFSSLYPLLNLSDFLSRHEEIARPMQVVIVNWQEPVKSISKTFLGQDMWFWLKAAFWTGVTLFGVRLMIQFLSLYRLHKSSKPVQFREYIVRIIDGDINPFSFWRSIYVNPSKHGEHELGAILEHEQIHVNELHTVDILLGELSAVFYWFNPGVWLMKRAIRENIEFITDQKILMKGVDTKAYQYSLLSVNIGVQNNALVNHFNISTIKKRIIMMNAERSSKVNITRYLLLLPAVILLLLIFSVSKAEMKKVAKTGEHMMKKLTLVVKQLSFINDSTAKNESGKKATVASTLDTPGQSFHFVKDNDIVSVQGFFRFKADTLEKAMGTSDLPGLHFIDTNKKDRVQITGLMLNATTDTNKITRVRLNGDVHPVIYVNGVKFDAQLNNISPDDITSIQVKKANDADTKGVIFVTTKGHDEKNISGNVIYVDTVKHAKLNGKLTGLSTVSDEKGIISVTTATRPQVFRINGKQIPPDKASITKSVINGDTVYSSQIRITRASNGKPDTTVKDVIVKGYATRTKPGVAVVNIARPDQSGISFKDKLVIIDGKESTEKELKKLSMDKVDSVSNLSGRAATNRYGDKAKNGAIIIKTKK